MRPRHLPFRNRYPIALIFPLSLAGLHHRLPGWRRGLRAREDRPLHGQVRAQPLQQAQEDLHVQGGAEAARRDQGVKLL